jgi:hypothetical protein
MTAIIGSKAHCVSPCNFHPGTAFPSSSFGYSEIGNVVYIENRGYDIEAIHPSWFPETGSSFQSNVLYAVTKTTTPRLSVIMLSAILPLLFFPTSFAQMTPSPTYAPPDAAQGTQSSTSEPNQQWSNVLGNSLWFYDAQRSGRLNEGAYENRVEWRNDSALEDGSDWDIDLTGGFYDAGDVSILFY